MKLRSPFSVRLFVISALAVLVGTAPQIGLAACPDAPDHTAAETDLLDQLANARNARDGQHIGNQLWGLYLDAPDRKAQNLLDEGMALRRYGDYVGSVVALNSLIAYCPDYAEGYNQRAFTYYLGTNFQAALEDLDKALELSPRHVPAMSGKALTLIGMGRGAAAQTVLRQALDLNPWLPERAYLVGPLGEDI